jgi:hypothetical protein
MSFGMEKTVKKGSTEEILTSAGFTGVADDRDGRKTAFKDRIFYSGIEVKTADVENDEASVSAMITWGAIQHLNPPIVSTKK